MYSCTGEQGCCSGESTYLPPLWPGFKSSVNAIQCMGVEVVVGSFHFSPLLKTNNSKIKFQFNLEHMRTFFKEFLRTPKFLVGKQIKILLIMWRKIIAVIYAILYNSSLCSSHKKIWFSYIQNFIIILSRVYNEPIQWPARSWLVSLTGRALHRYHRGKGSNPVVVQARIFFQAFFSQQQKLLI